MTAMTRWMGPIRSELRANPRLRAGAIAIIGILAFYALLSLFDWRAAVAERYVDKRDQLWRMQAVAGEDHWLGRADAAEAARSRLNAEIPVAKTVGLAQAAVQAQAKALADSAGANMRIQPEAPARVDGWEDLYRVPVVLSGGFEPAALVQLVRRVESGSNLVAIESVTYMNRQSRTAALTLVFFYRIRPDDQTAG
ncbi:hypothetical protein CNR27_14795 [Luteimonas chenhongjianii]|uniref:General secretion pathway protein GspM n=1 Tax=Luteimonas chenhongjianii TaxID=2006110 RepID=A0A290XHC4_9GAMM|nr:hypothetical protein [Luteimonas chenhongjianii]ATD68545.1 hypothetical protein CNR27_14795 [Luteimonas chenhongjianii]